MHATAEESNGRHRKREMARRHQGDAKLMAFREGVSMLMANQAEGTLTCPNKKSRLHQ